jgi:hypothetical protein
MSALSPCQGSALILARPWLATASNLLDIIGCGIGVEMLNECLRSVGVLDESPGPFIGDILTAAGYWPGKPSAVALQHGQQQPHDTRYYQDDTNDLQVQAGDSPARQGKLEDRPEDNEDDSDCP